MANISDIATRAEVSEATVSKVINGTGSISRATISRIRQVMEEVNYKPRPNKRRHQHVDFSKKQLHMAAFLVPDSHEAALHTSLSSGTIYGIEDVLYAHGASLIATHLQDDRRLPPSIEKGQVDALFIRGGVIDSMLQERVRDYPVAWLYNSARPTVLPGDQIQPDDESIGQMAADYLSRRGCGKFVFFSPSNRHPSFHMRVEAFRISAINKGVAVDGLAVAEGERFTDKIAQFKKMLGAGAGFFIAGFNADNNESVLGEARRGLFPDVTTIAATVGRMPGCASIGVSPDEVGREAARVMLRRFEKPAEEYRRILIPPKLSEP